MVFFSQKTGDLNGIYLELMMEKLMHRTWRLGLRGTEDDEDA